MGFYIRKAISLGPFRFNLSKSGVGVSVGIPGFRVGMSPRGNYVHMGRGGLYYRATIPRGRARGVRPRAQTVPQHETAASAVSMTEIESAATQDIVDSSFAHLVAEMSAKRARVRLWPFVLVGGVALGSYMGTQDFAPLWVQTILGTTLVAAFVVAFFDRLRKTTIMMYELDEDAEGRYQKLHAAFQSLGSCSGMWHISASGNVHDRKYHAGASSVVRRTAISIRTGNPPYVKTNVSVPSLPVGKQTLYFFPDTLLVFEPNAVGAVSYNNLGVGYEARHFVEEESVPKDAQIAGSTWKYVNKKGGPDKRFKDNRQLPIAIYEEISFASHTGLKEVIQVSRVGRGEEVAAAIKTLAGWRDSP